MALNALDSVCGWTFGDSYTYTSQVVFGLPFAITPIGYLPAGNDGWSRFGYPFYSTSEHYLLQHPLPDGPHTPVVQIVPVD